MKNYLVAIALLFSIQAIAQDNKAKPSPLTYKQYNSFPGFSLLNLDSTKFNSLTVLEDNKPTVVIYFSPTCSHCQHQAEEITGHIKDFENVNFLMVSSYSIAEIRQFAETYAISHFRNIKLAYDGNASLVQFYDLKSLPGIFVYDKKGKLKKTFPTNVTAADLAKAIKS